MKKANTNSVHTSASYQFSVGRTWSPTDYAIVSGENNTRFAVEKKNSQKLRLFIWPMVRIKTCSRGVPQKIACITGALWTKRGKHGILREARNERTARDEGRRKENARLALMQATQKIPLQMKPQSLLTLSSWVGKVWLSFLIIGWKSWFAKWFHQFNPTLFLEPSPPLPLPENNSPP